MAFKWREPKDPAEDPKEYWLRPAHTPVDIDGEESYACPRQHIHEHGLLWRHMLGFYAMYQKGHLPQAGAVIDQSNVALEVFRIFDDMNAKCDKEQDRIAKEKAKRGSRGR